MPEKEKKLGIWGKYLALWVALCIGAGIGLGRRKQMVQINSVNFGGVQR